MNFNVIEAKRWVCSRIGYVVPNMFCFCVVQRVEQADHYSALACCRYRLES